MSAQRWPVVGIAELEQDGALQLGRGKVISKKDLAANPGTYPVYSSAKENEGQFGEYGEYMFDEELITWSVDGGGRLFHRPRHRFSITNVGGFVRVLDKDRIFCRYLFHALTFLHSQVRFDWVRKAHPSVIRKVYTHFPLPPLEEQKRVAATLDMSFDELKRARAHAEANLSDTEKLFEAELHRGFVETGANVGTVGFEKVCKPITPRIKVQRKDYLPEGAHPIVSQEAELISGYSNQADALLSLDGPVVVFGDHTRCLKFVDFDFVVGADGTKVLKPATGIDPHFLYYGLRSKPIAERGYARHFKLLREVELPNIDLNAQKALAHRMSELEQRTFDLAERYEAKVVDLDQLRHALLRKALAGDLT